MFQTSLRGNGTFSLRKRATGGSQNPKTACADGEGQLPIALRRAGIYVSLQRRYLIGTCAPGTGPGRAGRAAGGSMDGVGAAGKCAWKCSYGTRLKEVPAEPSAPGRQAFSRRVTEIQAGQVGCAVGWPAACEGIGVRGG